MSKRIALLDVVEVRRDLPERGVSRGLRGTIVESLGGGAYEVEFADGTGATVRMAALDSSDLKVVSSGSSPATEDQGPRAS
jgi:hypothetical protein